MISIGQLVYDRQNPQAGTAKVTLVAHQQAQIAYFSSVAQQITHDVPISDLIPCDLQPQNRVYVRNGEQWLVGRIKMCRTDRSEPYWVAFPNGFDQDVAEHDLYIRANGPVEPLDILKLHAHETAYFFDRRWPVVEQLTAQRAASGGLAGFLSSNIDLQLHQLDTVQAVLRDPIRRYLLADEVGLGKTIEAGIILRQTLLEHPQAKVTILVPDHLKAQWCDELRRRFFISVVPQNQPSWCDFPDAKVSLRTHSEGLHGDADLVIIDEAHHLTAQAFGMPAQQKAYQRLAGAVHQARDVLLLSATPASSNQQAYLGMLHLLEPLHYHLQDLASFENRVAVHEQLSQALFALKPRNPPAMMTRVLEQLRSLFPNDRHAQRLIDNLLSDPQVPNPTAVTELRGHLGDTYRLHRRLIRHRRAALKADLVRGRRASPDLVIQVPEWQPAWDALDVWREALALADERHTAAQAHEELAKMLEAAQQGIPEWQTAVKQRLGRTHDEGEESALTNLERELLAVNPDRMDSVRADTIRKWFSGHPQKCVVFLSSASACGRLARLLEQSVGRSRVFTVADAGAEDVIERFRNSREAGILLVDQMNEEGLNLQCADQVLHLDFPMHPRRLEQRVGRLDRYAQGLRVEPMTSTALPFQPWCAALQTHLQSLQQDWEVFEHSIASFQHLMDSSVQDWLSAALQGETEMKQYRKDLPERLLKAKQQVQRQEMLENIHQGSAIRLEAQYEAILDAEAQGFDRSFNDWVQKTLQFTNVGTPPEVRYKFDKRRTMVPWEWMQSVFGQVNDRPSSFSRRKAQQAGLHLLRLGDPFVTAIQQYLSWDDRGRVFTYWRADPRWTGIDTVFFKLHFVIEADADPAHQAHPSNHQNEHSARQILDDLSPPMTFTVTLDSFGRPASPEHESLLQPRYRASAHAYDYNLSGERLKELQMLLPGDQWTETCDYIYSIAKSRLEDTPAFQKSLQDAVSRTETQFAQHLATLRSRLAARQPGVSPRSIEQEQVYQEALLRGIQHPKLTLDAIGAVVLSRRNPFLNEEPAQAET